MKRLVLVMTVMFSMSSLIAQTPQKIAHVNSQKLLDTLPSRKAAIVQLKRFEEEGIKELQEMEADFNKGVAYYEANKHTYSPVIMKIEEEKLMKKQQSLQDREQSLNAEMQAVSQELNKPILDRVQKAVEIVSERKKLNYVIDESVTLYFKGGTDITSEVVVELLRLDLEANKPK
jgi:outer membrane protein